MTSIRTFDIIVEYILFIQDGMSHDGHGLKLPKSNDKVIMCTIKFNQ